MSKPSAGLYIHMPWCIKKCPYCDFNSHASGAQIPEEAYVDALIQDFKTDINLFGKSHLSSIFIGGGTPSLFSAESYQRLFAGLNDILPFSNQIEITLEANPGTFEQNKFAGYLEVGINRLSLGVQSFNANTLQTLGRIHNEQESVQAIQRAKKLGFKNINLDLMYANPHQTIELALDDLEKALDFEPSHLSWYQFTIEPNTYFYRYPPPLPSEEAIHEIEERGLTLLTQRGYQRYEISAFARDNQVCQHNLNYWTFGDYYGIGAGAHGKLTHPDTQHIVRTQKHRIPKQYLNPAQPYLVEQKTLSNQEKLFEFILNTSRLDSPIALSLLTEKTGLSATCMQLFIDEAVEKQLIKVNAHQWQVTSLGRRFTNDIQLIALEKSFEEVVDCALF